MKSNLGSWGTRLPISIRLLIVSFLSLYFELALIRWLPSEIRILAYFTNLTLISCVLGLGIGAIFARKKPMPAATFPVLLGAMILFAKVYSGFQVRMPLTSGGYFLWGGLSWIPGTLMQYPVMFCFFLVNTIVFLPIGQILGIEFERLPALRAYSVNVLGALLGIGCFAAFSVWQVPPVIWFIAGTVLFMLLVPVNVRTLAACLLAVAVAATSTSELSTYWSPYYKIKVITLKFPDQRVAGYDITVNQDSHQQAMDLSGKYAGLADIDTRRNVYDQPYVFGSNDNVLVLGAGTGNDVAAALRAGAKHVDAVEIDPVIQSLGRQLHPEHPYADPRVQVHIKDARTYLRTSGRKYDKIVLGYLDSHSLFSAMSSVRLDNFIYTREFFGEIKNHLAPKGILSVTFTVHERWIADRLYSLLTDTFGAPPLVYQGKLSSSRGTVFLGGLSGLPPQMSYMPFNPAAENGNNGPSWTYSPRYEGYVSPAAFSPTTLVPSDNWPYLYLRTKSIPLNYALCLLVLLIFSWLFVGRATNSGGIRWQFFFLGAGFLVLETKAMTELAIFLGSTWVVNSFVIATVLGLILIANWVVSRGWLSSTGVQYTLLLASLVGSYLFPLNSLLQWDSPFRNWLAVLILCLPLFFAGLIFAGRLKDEKDTAAALGSNLLGAVLGGFLEYSSMLLGLKSLYLFAIGLYIISYLAFRLGATRPVPQLAMAAQAE